MACLTAERALSRPLDPRAAERADAMSPDKVWAQQVAIARGPSSGIPAPWDSAFNMSSCSIDLRANDSALAASLSRRNSLPLSGRRPRAAFGTWGCSGIGRRARWTGPGAFQVGLTGLASLEPTQESKDDCKLLPIRRYIGEFFLKPLEHHPSPTGSFPGPSLPLPSSRPH